MTATPIQIENFKLLREKGVFGPEQEEAIKLLEEKGLLNQAIPTIVRSFKEKQALKFKGASLAAPEMPETPSYEDQTQGFVGTLEASEGQTFREAAEKITDPIVDMGRPLAQAIGTSIGGAAGAPAGVEGLITGSALGYAMADDAADLFANMLGMREPQPFHVEFAEAIEKVAEGAAFELGGQVLNLGVSATGRALSRSQILQQLKSKLPPLKASSGRALAGRVLAAELKNGSSVIAKNVEEAQLLEELVPGLSFQLGQLTDDTGVLAFERALGQRSKGFAIAQEDLKKTNTKALQDFIERIKGEGSLKDARAILKAEEDFLSSGVLTAEREVMGEASKLKTGREATIEAGTTLRKELELAKKKAKTRSSDVYEAISTDPAPVEGLMKKIEDLAKPYDRADDVAMSFPPGLRSFYSKLLDTTKQAPPKGLPGLSNLKRIPDIDPPMSYKDLNDFRKKLSKELNVSQSLPPGRRTTSTDLTEKRLTETIDTIESILDEGVKKNVTSAKEIRAARKLHRETVYEPFKTGRVSEVLTGDKISDAQIAKKFFEAGDEGILAAREFKNAVGTSPVAREALTTAVQKQFLDEVVDPVTNSIKGPVLTKWLKKYEGALREYQMYHKFRDVKAAQKQLDSMVGYKEAFDKSAAAKALQADPGQEVKAIMTGTNRGYKMLNLMRSLKGDKKAIQGVRNYLVDELQAIKIDSAKSINKFMSDNGELLNAAFANEPSKIQALKTYQSVVKRLHPEGAKIVGDNKKVESLIYMLTRSLRMSREGKANLFTTLQKTIQHYGDEGAAQLLTKASLDPDFAFGFISALRTKNPEVANRYIASALSKWALLASNEE